MHRQNVPKNCLLAVSEFPRRHFVRQLKKVSSSEVKFAKAGADVIPSKCVPPGGFLMLISTNDSANCNQKGFSRAPNALHLQTTVIACPPGKTC